MIKLHCKNGLLIAGTIAAVLLSSGVQAANCTIDNWSGAVGLDNEDAGPQDSGNLFRRYAGPCGLRVPLAGAEAYVRDTSPVSEEVYNVRFYFFLNSVANNVTIFKAETADDGSGVDVISATYNAAPVQKIDVVFSIGAADGTQTATVTTDVVSSGWNSLEIQWANAAATRPKVILNGSAAVEPPALDTRNFTVELVKLGAISGPATVPPTGTINFDDFDSRRDTVPGRLLTGDVNGDGVRRSGDITALVNDLLDTSSASGQPDCNEDGRVTSGDITCLVNLLSADS